MKLTLAYDGAAFSGWQIQPGQATVQGVLSDTLRQITQEPVIVYGAGRTDAGVHAWGQVANFATASRLTPEDFPRALNALLPLSVRVRHAEEVTPEFHARWHAQAKTYAYRIYCGAVASPFVWPYVLHDRGALDLAAMAEAARSFIGEHDFATFAASTGSEEIDQDRVTRRVIWQSEVLACGSPIASGLLPAELPWPIPGPDEIVYVVRGRSFLRHMVRKIVGTLLEVGHRRKRSADIPRLIEARDRTQSGPTAPPQGLCLLGIEYSESPESAASSSPGEGGRATD
jgi:tRNA pseudouridine38-40 synthase